MEFLKNAWRNTGRRPARSLLTILSIAIGAFSVMLIGAVGLIGQQAVASELAGLGLQGLMVSGEDRPLTEEVLTETSQEPSVAGATPFLVEYTDIRARGEKRKAAVWGVDSSVGQVISMELQYGREITPADVRSGAHVCLVEENLAMEIFHRENAVGKTLTVTLNGAEEKFTIVGVMETGGALLQGMMGDGVPLFAYLPYTVQQDCTGREDFDRIAVKLKQGVEPEDAKRLLSRQLGGDAKRLLSRQLGGEEAVKVENMNRYAGTVQQVLSIVSLVLAAIAGISLLVACLSVMTTMLCSVGERTREIGIKKSIGASPQMIVWEFLLEAGRRTGGNFGRRFDGMGRLSGLRDSVPLPGKFGFGLRPGFPFGRDGFWGVSRPESGEAQAGGRLADRIKNAAGAAYSGGVIWLTSIICAARRTKSFSICRKNHHLPCQTIHWIVWQRRIRMRSDGCAVRYTPCGGLSSCSCALCLGDFVSCGKRGRDSVPSTPASF